jgi:hypothetical protein
MSVTFQNAMRSFLLEQLREIDVNFNSGGAVYRPHWVADLDDPAAFEKALAAVRVRPACKWPRVSDPRSIDFRLHFYASFLEAPFPLLVRCENLVVFASMSVHTWSLYNISHLQGTPVVMRSSDSIRDDADSVLGLWDFETMQRYSDEDVQRHPIGDFHDLLPKRLQKKVQKCATLKAADRETIYRFFDQHNQPSHAAIMKFLLEVYIANVCFEL